MLELGHAHIAFCLVAVEGNTRVGEKTLDIVGVLARAQEKIDRGRLLDAAALSLLGTGAVRIVPQSFFFLTLSASGC